MPAIHHRADHSYQAQPFADTRWDALAGMVQTGPASVPRQRRSWALWASLAAHGGLIVALMFSVSWRSTSPAALQAELWPDLPTPIAAPPLDAAPQVEPQPTPKPELPIQPAPPEPEAITTQVVTKPPPPKAVKPEPAAKPTKPAKAPAPDKTAEKAANAKTKAHATKEAERNKELVRLNTLLGAAGGAPKVGAVQIGNPTDLGSNWGAKLKACVQPYLRFADGGADNPRVEVLVQLLPSGSPASVTVRKTSGLPAFDAAVERAIMRCDPFPRPEGGGWPSSLTVVYRLKD